MWVSFLALGMVFIIEPMINTVSHEEMEHYLFCEEGECNVKH